MNKIKKVVQRFAKTLGKINKLSLPVVILIASVILGGFYYASQVNKQKSIERQQEIKLQDDRRAEEAKAVQTKKEYIAKRKNECYAIYEKERDEWNNVDGSFYREGDDVCVVRYENKEAGKDAPFSGGWNTEKEIWEEGKYFNKEF